MTAATVNSNRMMMGRAAMLAACLLAGTSGVALAASPQNDVPSIVVAYGDLDLSSAEGPRTLYKRISIAARQVCPFGDSRDLARVALGHACREKAIARAVHDVNSQQLAALHADRVKRG